MHVARLSIPCLVCAAGNVSAFGTGSFRYGTGGMASGRYDQLKSLKRRVAAANKKKPTTAPSKREMWDMTDEELIAYLEHTCVGRCAYAMALTVIGGCVCSVVGGRVCMHAWHM